MTLRGTIVFLAGVLAALGAGWAGFPRVINRTQPQPVDFSHQVHADKASSKCDDCHSFRADGSFTGIPTLDKCAACHAAPMGTTAAEKSFIDRYVTPQREPEWLVYARQPENVYFSHSTHVKRGNLKCERCHGKSRNHRHAPPLPGRSHQRLLARYLGRRRPSRNDHGRLRGLPPPGAPRIFLSGLPQMKPSRRDAFKFAGGAMAGVLFTPAPWRLITDTALWSENWPGVPRPRARRDPHQVHQLRPLPRRMRRARALRRRTARFARRNWRRPLPLRSRRPPPAVSPGAPETGTGRGSSPPPSKSAATRGSRSSISIPAAPRPGPTAAPCSP